MEFYRVWRRPSASSAGEAHVYRFYILRPTQPRQRRRGCCEHKKLVDEPPMRGRSARPTPRAVRDVPATRGRCAWGARLAYGEVTISPVAEYPSQPRGR